MKKMLKRIGSLFEYIKEYDTLSNKSYTDGYKFYADVVI